MERITPENLRELRKKLGLSSQQAADSVYKNRRLWQRYEAPVTAGSSLNIPPATLELFCLKHGLPYPPNKQGKLGKLLSFYGGQGGAGQTLLTIDICTALMADGYEVLMISGSTGCAIFQGQSARLNFPFPRTIEIREFPSFEKDDFLELPDSSSPESLKPIIERYDFVFLDLSFSIGRYYFESLEPDLIIAPAKISEDKLRNMTAFNNLVSLAEYLYKQKIEKTKYALLMVGVSTHYTFSPEYYGLINEGDVDYDEKRSYHFKEQEEQEREQEELIELFNNLKRVQNMHFMNSYTSNAYNSYAHRYGKGYSIFNKAPNSLPAHELRSVKNEILRLLGVPERSY
ncbi:hypothetical protein [Pseudoalteromonas prydzensis]|uniref:hypothetical protein n=1 Tax=Pseudoalteromonas prydzensis TaxID=182141 RepID=UPI0007E4F888|nr:hypothetical protein [Pseudoalteromonas prydzensis]MBE0379221.1 hypothetical protein [Pseudoalteromonas prydzensis ACAM 620]